MLRPSLLVLPLAVAILALATGGMTTPNQATTMTPEAPSPAPPAAPENWQSLTGPARLADLLQRRTPDVTTALKQKGFQPGDAAFLRIMKENHELELWLQPKGSAKFLLYKTATIARWSGDLGPKQKEGDRQAPEGFYGVTARSMNPQSTYHLSFNIGYPNALDRAHQRTGGLIMVHGKDVSIGCFAMTDPVIEELYLILHWALAAGQTTVPVHCYPFRMTEERLNAANSRWRSFWQDLKTGWDRFEQTRLPPEWSVKDGRYVFP